MSGLPNLHKLVEQATPGPWGHLVYDSHEEGWVCIYPDGQSPVRIALTDGRQWTNYRNDAALIAAAPALAELLIECEQALRLIADPADPHWDNRYATTPVQVARAALARLADYDRSIGA